MTTTAAHTRRIHADRVRTRKAHAAVDAIIAAYDSLDPRVLPTADDIAFLDDDGWTDLARIVGRPFESAETRTAVVRAYTARMRIREQMPADPFDGLDDEVWS